MISIRMTLAALLLALPAQAQDAPADEPLPPRAEHLPAAGKAPVDEAPAISDVAPDDGAPDAESLRLACHFTTECVDATCGPASYKGRLTVISDGVGMAEVEWDAPKETVSMSGVIQKRDIFAADAPEEEPLQRIFSVLGNGEARYTTHLGQPLKAITYIGSCEVAK